MEITIGNRYTVSLAAAKAAGYTDDTQVEAEFDGQIVTAVEIHEDDGVVLCDGPDGLPHYFYTAALIPLEAEPCARCADLEAQVARLRDQSAADLAVLLDRDREIAKLREAWQLAKDAFMFIDAMAEEVDPDEDPYGFYPWLARYDDMHAALEATE